MTEFLALNSDKSVFGLNKQAHTATNKAAEIVHHAAWQCLARVDANNDVRPLNHLYAGLKPAARLALKAWAVKFGKVRFETNLDGFKAATKTTLDADTLKARAEIGPFEYQRANKPKVAKVFDLASEIKKLAERAGRHNITGKPVELLLQAAKAA